MKLVIPGVRPAFTQAWSSGPSFSMKDSRYIFHFSWSVSLSPSFSWIYTVHMLVPRLRNFSGSKVKDFSGSKVKEFFWFQG